MSTRSIVAFETEAGVVGVYVHSDGSPGERFGRLATYRALIERDGAPKVCATILAHRAWSFIFDERYESLGEEVEGYGTPIPNQEDRPYFTPDKLNDWWDSEYLYVIHPETGEIKWTDIGVRRPDDSLKWDDLEWKEES